MVVNLDGARCAPRAGEPGVPSGRSPCAPTAKLALTTGGLLYIAILQWLGEFCGALGAPLPLFVFFGLGLL